MLLFFLVESNFIYKAAIQHRSYDMLHIEKGQSGQRLAAGLQSVVSSAPRYNRQLPVSPVLMFVFDFPHF